MKKEDYIKKTLEEAIVEADKFIKEREDMNSEVEELPNDCKGVEIDGVVCENPDYKIDILTSNYHSIGYMVGVRKIAKEILMLNDFSNIEFEDFLKEQEKIRKHNDKVMSDMKEYIRTKNPDLLNKNGGIG